jgi:hypothetical protein
MLRSVHGPHHVISCSSQRVDSISKIQSRLDLLHALLGLFTVAIFGSFSHVWQKKDQNGPKNEVKNDVKIL